MCLGVTLGVILPAGIIGSVLSGQATHAVTRLRAEFHGRPVASVADVVALPWVTEALRWVEARTGITPQAVLEKAAEAVTALSTFVAATSGGFVLGFIRSSSPFS